MPAGLTRSEIKHYIHERQRVVHVVNTLIMGFQRTGSDDIQIPDIKLHTPNLGSGSWDMIFLCQ